MPYIGHAGELKTKPTQHSVNELRRIGIQPHALICRSEQGLGRDIRRKIALFASLPEDAVISARDVDNTYKVPLVFRAEGVDDLILDHFGVEAPTPELSEWEELIRRADASRERRVKIALVGKYVQLDDAYKSVDRGPGPRRLATTAPTSTWSWSTPRTWSSGALEGADGDPDPGGFGERGIEGKIEAARIARETAIPYLGICLGMQIAVVEFARHVCGMDGANSAEFDPETPYPVIDLLPEQKEVSDLGGTMRLGADPVKLHEGTRARRSTARPSSTSATATATRSTTSSGAGSRRRAWSPAGPRPTSAWSRSSSCPTTRSSSPRSSIPSSTRADRPEPLFREFVGAAASARPRAARAEAEPADEDVALAARGRRAALLPDGEGATATPDRRALIAPVRAHSARNSLSGLASSEDRLQ